ncbi:LPS export ABC transporter periplasmic protein LptC [Caldimonas tepidiphila]|uniref:LPS export ABC transporter periplasmic protein LptC n=1 Tax=Caldimonas tepidiphila TaxID=2315841 RepID=UPI000E5B8B11|nr:LPS export ABC transporter periplasmic protein LptC [Caldimonas tepidiphila]
MRGAPGGWRARLHGLSAYLPALLMALLAAATWWLVRNTPVPDAPRPERPPRHEPDYVMNDFSVQLHRPASGAHALLEGGRLRHYPDNDLLEIDEVRLRATDELGRVTVATARRALAQGDGSEVELIGDAQVRREAGGPGAAGGEPVEFRGEQLKVFPDTGLVLSEQPVQLRRGGMQVQAESLRYDKERSQLELQGRVRGSLPPPAGGR